jgi:hypothetical protein
MLDVWWIRWHWERFFFEYFGFFLFSILLFLRVFYILSCISYQWYKILVNDSFVK